MPPFNCLPPMPMPMIPPMSPFFNCMMAPAFSPYVQAVQYAHQQSLASTPQQSAPAKNKEQTSPSLAAVQARVHCQNKKREELLESQVMHEYYQEKYGVKK
eukprot:5643222-Pleurochrysis_carterae.AAC.1